MIQLSSSLLWFLSVKDLLLQDWFPAGLLLAKFYGSQLYLMLKVINPGKRQRWLRPQDMPCWIAATTRLGPPWLCHGCGWCLHSLDEWSSRLQLACHIAWSPPQDWVGPSLCPSHECGGENRAGKVWTSEKEQRSNTYPSISVSSVHFIHFNLHKFIFPLWVPTWQSNCSFLTVVNNMIRGLGGQCNKSF